MRAIWIKADRELMIRAEHAELVWMRDQLGERGAAEVAFDAVPAGAPGAAVARGRFSAAHEELLRVEVEAHEGSMAVRVTVPSLQDWLDEILLHNDAAETGRPGWHAHFDAGPAVMASSDDQLTFVGPTLER